jgi:hypothetical protein
MNFLNRLEMLIHQSFCKRTGSRFWTITTTVTVQDRSRWIRLNYQTVKRIAVVYSKDRQVFSIFLGNATLPNCGDLLIGSYYQVLYENIKWRLLITIGMVKMYEIKTIRSQSSKSVMIRI